MIWYVQIVHYPQFADVGEAAFRAYHRRHSNLTSLVVALPIVAELGLAGLFVALRPAGFPAPLAWATRFALLYYGTLHLLPP